MMLFLGVTVQLYGAESGRHTYEWDRWSVSCGLFISQHKLKPQRIQHLLPDDRHFAVCCQRPANGMTVGADKGGKFCLRNTLLFKERTQGLTKLISHGDNISKICQQIFPLCYRSALIAYSYIQSA